MNLQRERQQRGAAFQDEMRRSWRIIPNCWRMRVSDFGATRPADELILLKDINILAEHKRTNGIRFEFSFLRVNQIKGLLNFDSVLKKNYGIVFVSFLNEKKDLDTAYALRLMDALVYMKKTKQLYIPIKALENGLPGTVHVPRITIDGLPAFDLKGAVTYFTDYAK